MTEQERSRRFTLYEASLRVELANTERWPYPFEERVKEALSQADLAYKAFNEHVK